MPRLMLCFPLFTPYKEIPLMSSSHYIARHLPVWAPAGWPDWVNWPAHTLPTSRQVRALQRELGVIADGYPGPHTIRACAWRDWQLQRPELRAGEGLVIIGPRAVLIDVPTHTFFDDVELGTTPTSRRRTLPHQAIVHYDVTFSAHATHEVLARQDLSTHFCIDGDAHGTIWQYHCPALTCAWHGGRTDDGHRVNPGSIGVDLNNPADTRYAEQDALRRGRHRALIAERVHGHMVERLDYFPEQIQSLRVLMRLFEDVFGIPRDVATQRGVFRGAHRFRGWLGHYHLTTRKTDPSPLNWEAL